MPSPCSARGSLAVRGGGGLQGVSGVETLSARNRTVWMAWAIYQRCRAA